MYENFGKRLLDLIVALVALLILWPLILIVVIILVLVTRTNPFFVHVRPGFKEQPFGLIKLRTMVDSVDSGGANLSRITPFGKFLRSTSIDELPQLINVLKGELSLVGPRPLEMRYLPHYSEAQRRRHNVKPGITGLAQINGRNRLSWEQKFELDVEYVDTISFARDLKILAATFIKVVSMGGVNSGSTGNTVEPFVPRREGE